MTPTASLLKPRPIWTMQFTIFPFCGNWKYLLSEHDQMDNVHVLLRSVSKPAPQQDCEAEVQRIIAGVHPKMDIIVLGQEK